MTDCPAVLVSVPDADFRELIDAAAEVRDLLNTLPEMQGREHIGTGIRFVNAIGAAQRAYVSAASGPMVGGREAIARIIDPTAFALFDSGALAPDHELSLEEEEALEKADHIINLRAQPQAREDAKPVACSACMECGCNFFVHPAPDTMRVAVEALERIRDFGGAFTSEAARKTLDEIAALQAEQGAK